MTYGARAHLGALGSHMRSRVVGAVEGKGGEGNERRGKAKQEQGQDVGLCWAGLRWVGLRCVALIIRRGVQGKEYKEGPAAGQSVLYCLYCKGNWEARTPERTVPPVRSDPPVRPMAWGGKNMLACTCVASSA